MKHFLSVFILIVSLAQTAYAEIEELVVWEPKPNGIRYLIPKLKGETPEQFAERYQKAVKESKSYGKMENAQYLSLPTATKTFKPLPSSTKDNPMIAVVLNRPNQMTEKSAYLKRVVESFEIEGPKLYSIPIGLEEVLSRKEMEAFRQKINSFDGMLGVGGDDPHPRLYGQRDTSATNGDICVRRDATQIRYIRDYLQGGKGRAFLICGSMQRGAIASGHGFHADIEELTKDSHRGDQPVMREVNADPDSELAKAAGATRFMTSNQHHAAVDGTRPQDPNRPPTAKITSYNIESDGRQGQIVKSIEFPNNAGFGTQFHPEFRQSPEENRIMSYVATSWKMGGRHAPSEIVNCMEQQLKTLIPKKLLRSGTQLKP